ncbi:hypothetical protein [Pseudomonas phage vB_PseudoP-SA22]|nr:hypothetical protein [Pseudomonas phage vB_PseudoP-SA22]
MQKGCCPRSRTGRRGPPTLPATTHWNVSVWRHMQYTSMPSPRPVLSQGCTLGTELVQLQGFAKVATIGIGKLTSNLGNLAVDSLDGLHVAADLTIVVAFHGIVSFVDFPRRPSLRP